VVAVVGGLELDIHEVDRGGRGADKEDLHGGVVDGDEVGHQVQVARHEHHQEQDLRLAGDAGARAGLPDLGIRPRHHTYRMLTIAQISVAHPDPDRICMFLGLLDPEVRSTNPDPSLIKQK